MKVTITYRLEDEDDDWNRRIQEAYNIVRSFEPLENIPHRDRKGQYINWPEIRALFTLFQGEWTAQTAAAAIAHLRAVAQLAYRGREYSTSPASSTLRKATVRAFQVADDFEKFVNANLITIL